MSPVLGNSIWFHFACLHLLLQYGLQTNWWRQSVTCFYHYGIGEYSTVHFSVTLQSKFWMSVSRIWLFVNNFGAWKTQFGSLKVLEKCLNFVLWVCYEPWENNGWYRQVSLCCLRHPTAVFSQVVVTTSCCWLWYRESKLRSLGLRCIHSARRGYPSHDGAHIGLRKFTRSLAAFLLDQSRVFFIHGKWCQMDSKC